MGMKLNIVSNLIVAAGFGLTSFISSAQATKSEEAQIDTIVNASQQAHGLHAWWGKEVVVADVEIIFGGKKAIDGTFTFEAHGPRSRYDRKDGSSIIFDGKTAWVSPADAKAPKGRFNVLTWPWFIMAPFKMQGDGISLSDLQRVEVDGTVSDSVFQTFGEDMGDTPDDWYRIYINSETKLVDGMAYIVTYGKDLETANAKPSILEYFDYVDVDGTEISTRYELWYWDAETHGTLGEAPKATGTVSNIHFSTLKQADFSVPADARELPLN
jgi:hypothetical protein